MSAAAVNGLNLTAIILAVFGACVCLYAARVCNPRKKYFYIFAAFILLYFAGVYVGAWFGEWYVLRSGILTRIGVIALIGLITGWVIIDLGECRRG